MKNICASVGAVPTQGKKEPEVEKVVEEEEYTEHENEMTFHLKERPEYQISAVGRWCENSKGEIVGDVDTYFHHITTGQRCETAWGCMIGWTEHNVEHEIFWETLCMRIQNLHGLEQIICDEETFEV